MKSTAELEKKNRLSGKGKPISEKAAGRRGDFLF